MSSLASIATCTRCGRSVMLFGVRKADWLETQGWKNNGFETCPKCRFRNPDKDYWVKRDIDECSTSHHESFIAQNWQSMCFRGKRKKVG